MKKAKLCLFDGYGIELEYMIVDAATLDIMPICDQLIQAETGRCSDEVQRGTVAWSNEFVLHVIELKTQDPAETLTGLPQAFQHDINHIHTLLAPLGARLMPTAMHPWMNPLKETRLWPHAHSHIYEAFHRIFNCQGHGWANIQSTHLNLPFGNDEEFARLHAALRLIMPIVPALSASSPVVEGKLTGRANNRLYAYRDNAIRIPSISGMIIPESVGSRKEYETHILARIYQDLAPEDPEGILQHEWVNARGAIARFDRSAIELRLLDVQECPAADISIAAAIVSVVKALVDQRWVETSVQKAWPMQPLVTLLRATMAHGQEAVIDDATYRRALGLTSASRCSAGDVWQHLIETVWPNTHQDVQMWRPAIETILRRGNLSKRISQALGGHPSRDQLKEVYQGLCHCLESGSLWCP